ncbi:hybrid sensor histidine kinase/response regulator [Marinobacter salexigens]|uniref:histidine kinase n=1 Tax=Marinobacter salexigens TaxID=1925763 RepID=A0ABS6AE66_9GAMM|nr:ATP-binding protein [Marinobacter salexigens]MBU2875543.1 response regulator [Marinobacter salexigens]
MNYHRWIPVRTAITAILFLILSTVALANTVDSQTALIDLAKAPNSKELTSAMLAISGRKNIQTLSDALKFKDWQHPTKNTLKAPRQRSTTWLKAILHNSSDQALIRWLVLEPWQLNRVDAFFLNTTDGETIRQKTTGLVVPLQDRAVSNGKTIVPVQLNAGETLELVLKVYSDSLPFISIKNWEPVSYSQSIHDSRVFQIALFSGILTLLVVLVLQFNPGLMITGLWLLVAFVFETEKDGFFSNYLLSFLEDYSPNLRASAWVLTEQLFLTVSAFLLGLYKHTRWRRLLFLTATSVVFFVGLTFVLDGASIRNLGILVTGVFAILWLLMVAPALRIQRTGQVTMLLLLSIYWAVSSFLLLGYTFNFYYTSSFAAARIYVEILVAVALILTYSWQQKHLLKKAAKALDAQRENSRKALEQAVKDRTKDLNNALETARKASTAKVNFLGQVSHDLRSPLTAILGYAQLQSVNTVDAQKATQIILDRGMYMKDLIDGLVDYAHGISTASDEPRDIYLIAFIDNLVNHAHIIASKQNNRFQLSIETDLPTVIRCSSKQLQRILLNLLDNSAKYTSDGYFSLSVAVSEDKTTQTQSLTFRVSDTGCGISAEALKNIYTPFYQSSEDNPGAGLGLAICFELAENLGGNLELESEPGKGTTATCTIPCIVGDERLAAPSLAAVQDLLPTFDAKGEIAWVVEDSEPVSELLDDELTDMGFDVELAATTEAFALRAIGSAPAIIVTDYQLPGASGNEVLRIARAQWPKVPVILLSATQNSNPRPEEGSPERFSAYLSKPVDRLELRTTLAELCNLAPET